MLSGMASFSIVSVLVKLLSDDYPVLEVAFFRCLFSLIPAIAMLAAEGQMVSALKTSSFTGHIGRTLTGLGSMIGIFYAFHMMPIADAMAISFSGPLFVTLFSVWLLKEHVGPHRWAAVLIGFIGVLVILNPGGHAADGGTANGAGGFQSFLNMGALIALGSSVMYGLAMVSVRSLSRTETSASIVFYFSVLSTLLTALPLPFIWVTPTVKDVFLLAGTGLVAGFTQFCITHAFRSAPAAVVSAFNYTTILWTTLLGWLIWDHLPSQATLTGAGIVILSGLYIIVREMRAKATTPKIATPSPPNTDNL
jgi:drug/metabolite transporter (DMT)-like permease